MTGPYIPRVALFRGRGPISTAIRWQTRSVYSHAALVRRDGQIIEAWQGSGVRINRLHDWTDIDLFGIPSMTDEQWDAALAFAASHIGRGYDYWAIIRFISRHAMPQNDRWFCSELVFASLVHAGVAPLMRIHAAEVSPGALATSPLLVPHAI